MASVSDDFKIPKLNQDNFFAWSVRTKAALIQKNCWSAIDPGFDSDTLTQAEEKVNQRALSFLFLVVSDSYLDDIGHCEQAKEAWDILEEVNSNFGLLHVIILLRELVNVKKTKDMTMQEYMSTIQNLNRKVSTGGFNFDDRTLALFFLLGLPLDTYEGLVRSLEKDEATLTTKAVKSKLILEEKRIQRDEKERVLFKNDDEVQQGNQTKKKAEPDCNERKRDGATPRFVICFACGRKGHIARDCKMRKEKAETVREEKGDETKRAGAAVVKHKALCAKKESVNNLIWILDSGATDHMTSRRDKLFEFTSEGGTLNC